MTDYMNGALISDLREPAFALESLRTSGGGDLAGCVFYTSNASLLPDFLPGARRALDLGFLDIRSLGDEATLTRIMEALGPVADGQCLVIDMAWRLQEPWGGHAVEAWGALTDRLAEELRVNVVSLYDQETLVEEEMQAAFRVHRQFLAPSGVYENPFWLPPAMIETATQDDQLRFLLKRLVPDYREHALLNAQLPDAARGAAPDWVRKDRYAVATSPRRQRWHIHCLGELKVFVDGKTPVDWRMSGSSPRKSKLLFAYLLTCSRNHARIDQICEVLWPDDRSEKDKRNRLHHTVSTLRKTLGSQEAVRLSGDYYILDVPPGSWIDVERFEQLCRRGLALFRHDDLDGALNVYAAAERLYQGDLFEDLPIEHLSSELEDWCLPKRTWLRSMAAKLHYDMSKVLRQKNRLREAMEQCQRSLMLDPVDENGNIELVNVLLAQGRRDAIVRHYKQFERAIEDLGVPVQSTKFHKIAQGLIKQ